MVPTTDRPGMYLPQTDASFEGSQVLHQYATQAGPINIREVSQKLPGSFHPTSGAIYDAIHTETKASVLSQPLRLFNGQ